MKPVFVVMLGGAVGSGARYLLASWIYARFGGAFPWGTLTVNVIGCLVLGAVMQVALSAEGMSGETRVLLSSGLLGGFTTYSAFNQETLRYLQDGNWRLAVVNAGVTFVACLCAGFLGAAGVRAVGAG